ncbi:peptidoglycan recognition family protein [Thermosynechococcaceae cyanobacterium Okahandja]
MKTQRLWFGFILACTVISLIVSRHWYAEHQRARAEAAAHQQLVVELERALPPLNTAVPIPLNCTAATPVVSLGDVQRLSRHRPRETWALAHPSNYGDRVAVDIHGRTVDYPLLVVLHETVYSAASAIDYFQTYHKHDEDQASYHAIITRRGDIIYTVPAHKRAYGAGNSAFKGEQVQTNPRIAPSVNNFAYHISLETPLDGQHEGMSHSGYTDAQYRSLAWLVSRTQVPWQRITTHAAVDLGGERADPRSFDWARFEQYWQPFHHVQQSYCALLANRQPPSAPSEAS